jgi:predicted amidophosphoribosyltransferase
VDVFDLPPVFLIFVGGVMVVVIMMLLGVRRPMAGGRMPRLCRACGAEHPPFARYCRRCGREL